MLLKVFCYLFWDFPGLIFCLTSSSRILSPASPKPEQNNKGFLQDRLQEFFFNPFSRKGRSSS